MNLPEAITISCDILIIGSGMAAKPLLVFWLTRI